MGLRIEQLRPDPMKDRDLSTSEVWKREVAIRDEERVLVRAASGSGKTTLLSFLFGMRGDYEGRAFWDERPIHTLSKKEWSRIRREELGIVFQDLKLFGELTVLENILLKERLTHRVGKHRVLELLEGLNIGDQVEKPVHRLSTGQQQRVAIVRALCQPFRMLLLDEPFSHLDSDNVRNAGDLIAERVREEGAGMLLATLEDPYGLEYERTLEL